ncbi:DNA replication licensing factor, MCM5 component [Pseudoloma neurophilia]|uniref:DNA helicase n=1 Tax=Pseudoloma neurophilia TaxID=146866 RepID=A0A0R0M399_9MICR|nr:DNA replication licensing factor, MCM5 component [Pseudoloma neurophilia]
MTYSENVVTSADLLTNDQTPLDKTEISAQFVQFVNTFCIDSQYIYRNRNIVQMAHLASFNEQLYNKLLSNPSEFMNIVGDYQFISDKVLDQIRYLDASKTNRIVRMRGIITSVSDINAKPVTLKIVCRSCLTEREVTDVIPRNCKGECGPEPFLILPEKCKINDTQSLKVQEFFDDVPPNEIPRHCNAVLMNTFIGQLVPGNEIVFTGISLIKTSKQGSFPFIRIIGIEKEEKQQKTFTDEEIEQFKKLNFLESIPQIIAPNISGHEDVKKAIACSIFGGTKRIKNGVSLRGDVNILLLGDPGIAKSQLLKFATKISPISVYTSGKGSSAAGLTATVVRNNSGEYSLEGGALVLADQGICCIDEFDKMDDHDRVAIHEAMEQQTVSIAKAGITTILNTRTAIIAAANPKFGRYDDLKSPAENIEFGSTILSRFDCIFILKDQKIREKDILLAQHILDINVKQTEELFDADFIKRYILYAKTIHPELDTASREKIKQFYLYMRGARPDQSINELKYNTQEVNSSHVTQSNATQGANKSRIETRGPKNTIPITVRQLEAIIRMSEAFARMSLSHIVQEKHVDLAIGIFNASTMTAVNDGFYLDGMVRSDVMQRVKVCAEKIIKFVNVGTAKTVSSLEEYAESKEILGQAINYLTRKNKLLLRDRGRVVVRMP